MSRGGPRPGAGRPVRDLDGAAVRASLAAVRRPDESDAALGRRLGLHRGQLARALRDGVGSTTLLQWIQRLT